MSTPVYLKKSTIVDMDTIGTRLKAERVAKGFTQEALAMASGVTKQAISHIETDRTSYPQAATLEPICRKLGISVRWLLDGKSPKEPTAAQSQSVQIDADTIADAQDALKAIAQVQGVASADLSGWVNDSERLAMAINAVLTVKAGGEAGSGNIIDLMARIAERMRSGGMDAVKQATDGKGHSAASAANGKKGKD